MTWPQIVTDLLGGSAFAAMIQQLFRFISQRRRIRDQAQNSSATASEVLTKTAVMLLEPAREQIEFFQSEMKTLQAEVTALRATVADLTSQLAAANAELERWKKNG